MDSLFTSLGRIEIVLLVGGMLLDLISYFTPFMKSFSVPCARRDHIYSFSASTLLACQEYDVAGKPLICIVVFKTQYQIF